MKRSYPPQEECADLDWMRRYGRYSCPATAVLLVVAVLWPVHPGVIAFVSAGLAVQITILAYAEIRRRALTAP